MGVKFSGRVNDDKTTLTISKSDIPSYNKALAEVRNSKVAESFPEPKVSVEYHPHFDDKFILKEVATGGTLNTGTKQELIDFCKGKLAASVIIPQLIELIDKAEADRPKIDHFDISVYLKTAKEAKEHGELDIFRQNKRENSFCRDVLSFAVTDNYHLSEKGYGGTFDADTALKQALEKCPLDRIMLLVASRISSNDWDKRFTDNVHKWADNIILPLPESVKEDLRYVQINEHSGLVNMLAEKIMEKQLEIENDINNAVAEDVQKEMDKERKISAVEERDARLIREEPEKEAMLINGNEDTIAIYQLKNTPENHDITFTGLDYLEKMGKAVNRENYTLVYSYNEDLSNAIQVHVDAEDKSDALIQGVNGVPKKMTVLNESGLYSLILSSKLEAAKKFKRWVTSEVLPSIRKNGAYIAEEKFRASKAQFEELISSLEPKAEYYDVIMNSRNLTTISAIAYEYGTSASCLNHLLYRLGIQYKDNDTWYLTEDYAGKGYVRTDIRRSYDYRTNSYRSYRHTRWTQKGVEFLYRLLESIGITPVRSEVDINFIQIR